MTNEQLYAEYSKGFEAAKDKGLTHYDDLQRAGLRAVFEAGLKAGYEIARDEAEVSESDGWVRTAPYIDWDAADAALMKACGRAKCADCKGMGGQWGAGACSTCKGQGIVEVTP